MRFDKVIGLIILENIEDGLGGRVESEMLFGEYNSNIEELGLEATVKIYGDAFSNNIKATILGKIEEKIDRVKYNSNSYKVVKQRVIRNKTSFFLEVDND